MPAITMGEDRRNRKCLCRVTGRKARIDADRRLMTAEECVGEISGRWQVRRTQPPCRDLESDVNRGAVCKGFTGKQRRFFRVRIPAEISSNQKSHWNKSDFRGCDGSGESVVESFESRGAPEVGRVMWISGDETSSYTSDRNGRQPVLPSGDLRGKQPDVFLIVEKVSRKPAPGDVTFICCCSVMSRSVFFG